MKERSAAKRLSHPYARYSNAGQLSCALCGLLVKSEVLWPSHLTSKVHRNNVRREKEEEDERRRQEGLRKRAANDEEDEDDDENDDDDDENDVDARAGIQAIGQKRLRFTEGDVEYLGENTTARDSLPAGFFDNTSTSKSLAPSAGEADHQDSELRALNESNIDNEDEEWAAFEATLAEADHEPVASSSSVTPAFSAAATISAQEILYGDQGDEAGGLVNGGAPEGVDNEQEGDDEETAKETEQERRDREEKEELMERIET